MTGHLDLDGLADLLAGEGDDAQVDHVAGCGACSAALVELDQASSAVSAALAALPAPAVPEGLAARLDAALRAERRDEPGTAPVPGLRALPLDDEGEDRAAGPRVVPLAPRRRRPLLLGAAAAAAAVVLGGAAVTAVLQRGPGADTQAASAGSAGPEAAPTSAGAQGGRGSAPQAEVPGADSTGRDYGPGTAGLAEALPRLLGGTPAAAASSGDDGLSRLRDPAALAACLSALPGPAASPLALDYARYGGAPALVVLRPATDPGQVEVAVVGPQCRAGAPDTRLLTRLPRPS